MYGVFRAFVREVIANPRPTERTLIRRALQEFPKTREFYVAGSASGAIPGPYHYLIDQAIEWGAIAWNFDKRTFELGPHAGNWADIWMS